MNKSELDENRSKKENRTLASLLFIGFVGSACIHAAAMITPVPTLWKPVSKDDDIMEIVVDTTKTPEEKVAEVAKEPEPITKIEENQPIEAAPIAIALAPEITISLKEGKDAAAPDSFKPLLTLGASDTKIQQGGGSLISKDGIGSGFGNAKVPTGFVLGGKINGNPNGSKNGVIGGLINGKPNGKGTQLNAIFQPAPKDPEPIPSSNKPSLKLECLSCPKPQYRGKEGTPRVTYDIAPDGRVTNVRLRQSSGDEQTDRETIEAMSKWQFNPQTVPEGGRTDVKVRVTFEEEGSQFQRQNEQRRREAEQLAEQKRSVEQATQQRETERLLPAPTAITPVNNSTPERLPSIAPLTAPIVNTPAPTTAPAPEPITTPVITPPVPTENAPPVPIENAPPVPIENAPPVTQPSEPAPVITAPAESTPALPPPPPLIEK